jgi:hypothetical protein
MPRQREELQKTEATLVREEVNGDPYDVLYINGKEIVAFHLKNIEYLKLEHTNQSMLEAVTQLLS